MPFDKVLELALEMALSFMRVSYLSDVFNEALIGDDPQMRAGVTPNAAGVGVACQVCGHVPHAEIRNGLPVPRTCGEVTDKGTCGCLASLEQQVPPELINPQPDDDESTETAEERLRRLREES
jgi:hypothetical protein